jgi:hypothetical protein
VASESLISDEIAKGNREPVQHLHRTWQLIDSSSWYGRLVKLADTPDLGSGAERRRGSTPRATTDIAATSEETESSIGLLQGAVPFEGFQLAI